MARKYQEWTEEKLNKYLKEGRGQGTGSEYKPFIYVQDFSSMGRINRPPGLKTNRVHHLFSDMEYKYFLFLEWADDVIDIREQYPILDYGTAMKIADELEIKYPVDNITGTPRILTTDFCVTIKQADGSTRDILRTIKQSADLRKKRVIEKLQIEQCYWESKEIDWGIVTEKQMNEKVIEKIKYYLDAYNLEAIADFSLEELLALKTELLRSLYTSPETTVNAALNAISREYSIGKEVFLYLFRHLVATKSILVSTVSREITKMKISDLIIDGSER